MASTKVSSSSASGSKPRLISSKDSDISSTTNEEVKRVVKRLPPIKAPVGLAKSPDLKNCKSKIGSLHNIKHTPVGGNVTIQSQKLKWNASSKVGSLENKEHKPGGGKLKVESRKLEWNTTSKVQSLQNVHHKPGGGNVKIFNESYFEKPGKKGNQSQEEEDPNSEQSLSKVSSDEAKSLTNNMKNLSLNK